MKSVLFKWVKLTFVLCLITNLGLAQNSLGFNLGLSSYEGDLHCFEEPGQSIINSAGLTFGLQYKRELTSRFNARIAYQFARFSGDDKIFEISTGHPGRGFDFKNNMHELTARLDLEPWKQKRFSPFLSAGLGFGLNSPDTFFDFENKSATIQDLITQDEGNLSRLIMAVPLSLGANYRISDLMTLGAELGWRLGVTDYLDGVSVSGSTAHNDYFGTAAVTLNYTLGKAKMKTTKFVNPSSSDVNIPRVKKQPEAGTSGESSNDPQVEARKAELAKKKAEDERIAQEIATKKLLEEAKIEMEKMAAQIEADRLAAEKAAMDALDSDKDGVVDKLDACPTIYAKTISGCPDSQVTSDINCESLFGTKTVNFETSFANLSGEDKAKLNAVAEIMLACPIRKLVIEGHTDSRGSELVNQPLSEKRANQVKNFFISKGIDKKRILAVGYGETRPLASNDTLEGKALNRRVEVNFY